MYCKFCGKEIANDALFCAACGRQVADRPAAAEVHHGSVSFVEAIKLSVKNVFDFKSRASKSEFWWGFLFLSGVSTLSSWIPVLGWAVALAAEFAAVSLMIRRFHDVGVHWKQAFKVLIPFYGIYFFIVTCLLPSVGDNEWGPGPVATV